MNGREHFQAILAGTSQHCGFWHGNPHPDSLPALYRYFDVRDDIQLSQVLGDTVAWVMPEACHCWRHPEGRPMFDVMGGRIKRSLNDGGVFADCESVAEVEQFDWPDPRYLDFSETLAAAGKRQADGYAVLSGMWSPFFHVAADFFGMDQYFVKMYTHPEVVEAVTEHIVDFYVTANELYLRDAQPLVDALFFGNDFGSQLDLLVSPDLFRRYVLPSMKRIIRQARDHGLRVVLHSCGSIDRVIPDLIDAGVDILHPIQALASRMDADHLANAYNGKLIFMGGVDTQQILPFGTPQAVRDEVRRLRDRFGTQYIVSPSHEALLPNVPPENVAAMAEAARE